MKLHRHINLIFDRILSIMQRRRYSTQTVLFFYFLLTGFFSPKIYAATNSSPRADDLSLSFGNLCEFIGKIQKDGTGKKNTCDFLPVLALGYNYFLTDNFALAPQFSSTLPKAGRDKNIKRMALIGTLNGKYKTGSVDFIFGAGFFVTRIWGPGGDEILDNGDSSDSFPLPKEAIYSRNFIAHFGIGTHFTNEISSEIYTYIFNSFKKEERSFSLGLNFSYHFGDVL